MYCPSPPPNVWNPANLKRAALTGNVQFLSDSFAANLQPEYYLTVFHSEIGPCGNIFHLAVSENRDEFIRIAIQNLSPLALQQLLVQPRPFDMSTPLQLAVEIGNHVIVNHFLNVFKSWQTLPSPSLPKPWQILNVNTRETLCHRAITHGKEKCALAVLSMDMDFFCNTLDVFGAGLLYQAVWYGLYRLALEILNSATTISYAGFNNFTPLHVVTRCSEGDEICKLLLKKKPSLVEQKALGGASVFHSWAKEARLWPFDHVLKSTSNDITSDIKRAFINLVSAADDQGYNPLHNLARYNPNEEVAVQIAELLINTHKEVEGQASSTSQVVFPWLAMAKDGSSPLYWAIDRGYEKVAICILSVDSNALKTWDGNFLFFAIEKECYRVADVILEIMDKENWTDLLTFRKLNVLHLVPKCPKTFCERLLRVNQSSLEEIADKYGNSVMHGWVKRGIKWPFEYFLKSGEVGRNLRNQFINLITSCDYINFNNPFHVAASSSHEAMDQIVKLLVEAFKENKSNWHNLIPAYLPWFKKNKHNDGALHLAMDNKRETLAIELLSQHDGTRAGFYHELLDYYYERNTLFFAIEKKCYLVAKYVLARLDRQFSGKYLMDSSSGRNVLHLAPHCPEEFGRWLIDQVAPEFMTMPDKNGLTALHLASEAGAEWLIKAILEKHPSAISMRPLPWIKACEEGHVSAIHAFINHFRGNSKISFTDYCLEEEDTPLHHIKLRDASVYEKFLDIPGMKDLINTQDSRGETPLHKAIKVEDILLAEALLKMDIKYDIKDHHKESAQDLLGYICTINNEWDEMCKRVNFDPKIRTTYFQRKTNLLDVRNTLSVVAALLATITFTAGFTLPGGFNQNNGEAILAKKAAFLVFLISDALAMCCSMLVLICLIWSMVYDSNKSLFFIDRSMILLMLALYSTMLAFMTGVFIVISPQSLWAAILIIAMCSLIVISSVNSHFLFRVLDNLIPTSKWENGDPFRLLVRGRACLCRGGSSCFKCS